MPFDSEPAAEVTARDRVMRLRDFLATLPDNRFDIRWLYTQRNEEYHPHPGEKVLSKCGTAACIAGWTNVLFAEDIYSTCASEAAELLGLTDEQLADLFMPAYYEESPKRYTRARAVVVLDHYLATGEIDWSVAG